MPESITLDLTRELNAEQLQWLQRLIENQLTSDKTKLDHKINFILGDQEISLTHSIEKHTDYATGKVFYAVYGHTYDASKPPASEGKRSHSDHVEGEGSSGRVKQVLACFDEVTTDAGEMKLKQNPAVDFVVKKINISGNSERAKNIKKRDLNKEVQSTAAIYSGVTAAVFRNGNRSEVGLYVMPFFSGNVKKILSNNQIKCVSISDQQAQFVKRLNAVIACCDAVKRFHQDGYVHFDIKPENICYDSETDTAYLLDMAGALKIGAEDYVVGTDAYLPPEMIDACRFGRKVVAYTETDIYSLWIMITELLANQRIKSNEQQSKWQRPQVQFPGDYDWEEEADAFNDILVNALSSDPVDRPTIEETVDFFKAMRARYQAKLPESHPQKQAVATEVKEAALAKYENPKDWKDKLEELNSNIGLARQLICAERDRLVKKSIPDADLMQPVDIKKINFDDREKYDRFFALEAQLASEQSKIQSLIQQKPVDKTYRFLYQDKKNAVLSIVNDPKNIEVLGKHTQSIILRILNGAAKLLSSIFGSDDLRKELGAESTMARSAKGLLKIRNTITAGPSPR